MKVSDYFSVQALGFFAATVATLKPTQFFDVHFDIHRRVVNASDPRP
jgi:hypothetical protein